MFIWDEKPKTNVRHAKEQRRAMYKKEIEDRAGAAASPRLPARDVKVAPAQVGRLGLRPARSSRSRGRRRPHRRRRLQAQPEVATQHLTQGGRHEIVRCCSQPSCSSAAAASTRKSTTPRSPSSTRPRPSSTRRSKDAAEAKRRCDADAGPPRRREHGDEAEADRARPGHLEADLDVRRGQEAHRRAAEASGGGREARASSSATWWPSSSR